MLTSSRVDELLAQKTTSFSSEVIALDNAAGRVLSEDISADRDQPSADMAAMDGIAVAFSSFEQGVTHFNVTGVQKPGLPASSLNNPDECIEIMTGAHLPLGADTVIPYEDVSLEGNQAKVVDLQTRRMIQQYVRFAGEDYKRGELLLRRGDRLSPQHLGVLAAVGKDQVAVARHPHIAVVSTGDELIDIHLPAQPYQTRRTNDRVIRAILNAQGFPTVNLFCYPDDEQKIEQGLRTICAEYDLVIICGGISKGKFDFIPQVLERLSVDILIKGVKQKPGKPFLFGITKNTTAVFGLPGNPVSAQICLYRYVLPFLRRASSENTDNSEFAKLEHAVDVANDFVQFVPVRLDKSCGEIQATLVWPKSSGDFATLAKTQGFVELPGPQSYPAGSLVKYYPF